MEYRTRINYSIETLPWAAYVPIGSTHLILGTFPSQEAKRKIDFYYPNPANRFWNVMANLAEYQLQYFEGKEAVHERLAILDKLRVGLSSMGKKIIRIGDSSLDNAIHAVEYLDVFSLLEDHPTLHTLVLTSSSGKSSTLAWFRNYLLLNGVKLALPKKIILPFETQMIFKNRVIRILIVNSTSGISSKSFDYLLEQYDKALEHSSSNYS